MNGFIDKSNGTTEITVNHSRSADTGMEMRRLLHPVLRMRHYLAIILLVLPLLACAQSGDSTLQEKNPATITDTLTKILVYVPMDVSEECGDQPLVRRQQVDSVCAQHGLTFIAQAALASLAVQLTYSCPSEIDITLFERRLKEICPEITIHRS